MPPARAGLDVYVFFSRLSRRSYSIKGKPKLCFAFSLGVALIGLARFVAGRAKRVQYYRGFAG
ncbi:MAG TPA: hypothetical protein DEG78_02190 [Rhodobacteraceae bacterium]|nr:hypothetical protein [Paracoccaceae bacterium]HCC97361.1 hypothetical protein [Paracoccaceae bacterium]